MFSRIKRSILARDEELETLAWLISVIDSYRVGMGVDIKGMRERVRKLPSSSRVENWTQVYNDMKAITDLPFEKEPKIKLYMNIFAFMKVLVRQAFLIIGFLIFIFMLTLTMPLVKSSEQFQYIVYGIIGAAWVVVAIRAFVRDKMKEFYYTHMKEYEKNEQRLQKACQQLIDRMGEALTQKRKDGKKYTFSVYQKDYKGITIVKNPSWLRDFYVVAVKKR